MYPDGGGTSAVESRDSQRLLAGMAPGSGLLSTRPTQRPLGGRAGAAGSRDQITHTLVPPPVMGHVYRLSVHMPACLMPCRYYTHARTHARTHAHTSSITNYLAQIHTYTYLSSYHSLWPCTQLAVSCLLSDTKGPPKRSVATCDPISQGSCSRQV